MLAGAYFRNDFVANNLNKADREIRSGHWNREGNRGHELDGKTVVYGNMVMALQKLRGFEVEVLL
jgi:D-3-phosphoglycerate dehydrogenase